jgi:hypothetical protein
MTAERGGRLGEDRGRGVDRPVRQRPLRRVPRARCRGRWPRAGRRHAQPRRAYADAGAGGLFVPFLADARCIAAICEGSPLPVNVLWSKPCGDRAALASLGVARISHGHQPWAAAMAWLSDQARAVLGGGVPGYAA